MAKTKNLTKQQEIFATEYVKLDDASAAFRLAYNTQGWKSNSIHVNASKLLKNAKVALRVGELKEVAAKIALKEFNIDSEEILRHLNILRKANINEYVNIKDGQLVFKDFNDLTEEQMMCIESVKNTRDGIELKLHGKDWTIEKIARHIGFYEKDNIQSKASLTVSLPKVTFKTNG